MVGFTNAQVQDQSWDEGAPLPGASIEIKGPQQVQPPDFDAIFTHWRPPWANVLVVSLILVRDHTRTVQQYRHAIDHIWSSIV